MCADQVTTAAVAVTQQCGSVGAHSLSASCAVLCTGGVSLCGFCSLVYQLTSNKLFIANSTFPS